MKSTTEYVTRRREYPMGLLIPLCREGETKRKKKKRNHPTAPVLPATRLTHKEVREELLQKRMLPLSEHQEALEISHMAWNNPSSPHVPSPRGWRSPTPILMLTVLENSGVR